MRGNNASDAYPVTVLMLCIRAVKKDDTVGVDGRCTCVVAWAKKCMHAPHAIESYIEESSMAKRTLSFVILSSANSYTDYKKDCHGLIVFKRMVQVGCLGEEAHCL